jgi:uncharacterized metal-binding protein YceD (DUF177 family)
MREAVRPEFSRPIQVDALAPGVNEFRIAADAGEREALARRLGVVAVNALTAEFRLIPEEGKGAVRLSGTLKAEITQTCVVTLEPLTSRIDASVERVYALDAVEETSGHVSNLRELEELPDPIVGGAIDIGEAAAEELALEIDPFPKRSGASFGGYADPASPVDGRSGRADGPFAVLAKLKGGAGEDG